MSLAAQEEDRGDLERADHHGDGKLSSPSRSVNAEGSLADAKALAERQTAARVKRNL
jgi:hypothetical protein